MALYDGFFDAVADEGTGEYDRAYGPVDFTGYFENIIGSGVCIHNNPDSFKAEYEDGTLYLRPGYLFIRGYWLANKAGEGEANYKGYAVTLPAGMTGSMAVVAHLNLGQRLIEVEVRPVSQAYPDALVLAIVTAGAAEDTRHNTDLCGVVETAGELSSKVEWALNYIDTEIDGKLQQVEADIAAQDAKLDAKIAEIQAVVDSIVPPPVGSIKFSASQDAGDEWLKCDGSFISESQYPELVAALGKLTPSGDKFELISDGEIGPQISNGVLYGGRMWVYSYATQKLYGVDVEGAEPIKEISLASENPKFKNFIPPSTTNPIALSIVPRKVGDGARIFLAQILAKDSVQITSTGVDIFENFVFFYGEFHLDVSEIEMSIPFQSFERYINTIIYSNPYVCVPYVISKVENGEEVYYFSWSSDSSDALSGINITTWKDGSESSSIKSILANVVPVGQYDNANTDFSAQRVEFKSKNAVDVVSLADYFNFNSSKYSVYSKPVGTFAHTAPMIKIIEHTKTRTSYVPLNIVGLDKIVSCIETTMIPWASYKKDEIGFISPGISLPSAARVFVDAGAYLWGKDIYMFFVGTGIIFSRTLEEGSFGYLDTTSVLGTITQFGYLDYSQDEGTLYLLGQDTSNRVKVAKIVLNTLYDYANDGAWLPVIAADGVPAYIKAKSDEGGGVITDPVDLTVTVQTVGDTFNDSVSILFNRDVLIPGTYTRTVSRSGNFTVGLRIKSTAWHGEFSLKLNGTNVVTIDASNNVPGHEETATFKVSDFISTGVTLGAGS